MHFRVLPVVLVYLEGLPVFIACLLLGAGTSVAAPGGRDVACPDFDPQPTPIPKPGTILSPSPNFNQRDVIPGKVDSVVMHTTEVSLVGTLNIFKDRASSVSAHFVIAPGGDIYEMVDTRDRAWHATYYNSRSIGIEMVGFASQPSTWNENNLDSLVDLLAWIVTAYPDIPLVHPSGDAYDFANDRYNEAGIVSHGQVQPWNRSDPGIYFPWDDILDRVETRIVSVPEPNSAALLLLGVGSLLARRGGLRRPRT